MGGNLEDCVKKVLQKSKGNFIYATKLVGKDLVSDNQKFNDYKTKMKIAILAIVRLSEDQLLPEEKKTRHTFKAILEICKQDFGIPVSIGMKNRNAKKQQKFGVPPLTLENMLRRRHLLAVVIIKIKIGK